MNYRQLVPLVPIVFAIHNAEEAPRMAAWSKTADGRFHPIVSTRQFTIAVSLLTLAASAVTAWAVILPKQRAATLALCAVQAAIMCNVAMPHVGLFLIQRRYNPGLLSAAALNAPFSYLFFRAALASGAITSSDFRRLVTASPFIMAGSALAALRLGSMV